MCYEALLHEMSKKRKACPRLYLLRDNDMLELLCCGNNLNHIGQTINRVFNGLTGLKVTKGADKSIIGCYGMHGECLNLLNSIKFNGVVEDMLLVLESAIQEALRSSLESSLNGSVCETLTEKIARPQDDVQQQQTDTPKAKPKAEFKALETIIENPVDESKFMIASWILKNVGQIIEVSLKVLLTRQLDASLQATDSLVNSNVKIERILALFSEQLINHAAYMSDDVANSNKALILVKQSQTKKIELIVLVLLYYRDLINSILDKSLGPSSFEWLSQLRYAFDASTNEVEIKCLMDSSATSVHYGFDYVFTSALSNLLVYSPRQQYTMAQIMVALANRSNPLLHSSNAESTLKMFSQLVGRNNDFLMCTDTMNKDLVFNICKAVTLAECWTTLVNVHYLSADAMTVFASTMRQLNEQPGANKVVINKDTYDRRSSALNKFVPMFACVQADEARTRASASSSLMQLTRLKTSFVHISRDFYDKFKIIRLMRPDYKTILNSMLIACGFRAHERLASDLYEIIRVFASLLKRYELKVHERAACGGNSMLDHSVVLKAVRSASEDLYYQTRDTVSSPAETKALGSSLMKTLFAQLDVNSAKILHGCMRTVWPDVDLQYNQKILFDSEMRLTYDLPMFVDKEPTIAVEDRPLLNDVNDAVLIASKKLNLTPSVHFNATVLDILEHLKDMASVLLVGASATGKTSTLKVAIHALQELKCPVNFKPMYINSMSLDDIFGGVDVATTTTALGLKLSKDGLLSNIIKDFQNKSKMNILNIIGECEPTKAYLFESLFNENLMFNGPNNEKMTRDETSVRLIWETDEIGHLSPQLLSKSHIIYYTRPLMTSRSYFECNFQWDSMDQNSGLIADVRKRSLDYIVEIENEFKTNWKMYENALPIGFQSKVQFMITVLLSLVKNNPNLLDVDIVPIVEYAAVTGFTASLDENSRLWFDEWWKSKSKVYPKDGYSVYDYFYDTHDHQFQHWSDAIPTFSYPAHQGIPANAYVHTTTTISINNILDVVMNAEKSLMVVGATGCGKTSLIMEKLHASCSGDITDVFYITINANRMTDSVYIHKRINKNLIWKHSSLYVPKGNKKLYCFIDDIHLAKTDDMLHRQTAVEVIRQHLDSGYFYDMDKQQWQMIKNVTYIATYNPKIYSPSKSMSNKILKHFHVYYQSRPNDVEIEGILYILLLISLALTKQLTQF
jgi:GTPase SAR1 family protein